MSKEAIAENIQITSTGDCLAETICTIVNSLAPKYRLHPVRIQDALKTNTNRYLTNLFDLLAQTELGFINHHPLRVENNDEKVFQVLELALREGSLCEITVEARPWVKEVLGSTTGLPATNLTHSLVVYGYYWPSPDRVWFYAIDPYLSDHIFVDWWQLSEALSVDRNRVDINLFSLKADLPPFLANHSVKDRYLDRKTKKKILETLTGRNTEEKLKSLFRPRSSSKGSALRRRS